MLTRSAGTAQVRVYRLGAPILLVPVELEPP